MASPAVKSAVWSFWTPPYGRDSRWRSDLDHLLSWSLSFATASRFFETRTLVTDSPGARLLVDELQLPFDEVSTSLDVLDDRLSGWWILGKLSSYAQQEQPFIHFDSDVYLWQSLPEKLLTANILGQNPERVPPDESSYYKPKTVATVIGRHKGFLPAGMADYVHNGGEYAANMGIFGGSAWEAIREYAHNALEMIIAPANRKPWEILGEPFIHSILVEQYYLAAYCATLDRAGRFGKPSIDYLFSSEEAAFREPVAAGTGYTHLMGAKRNPRVMQFIAARLRRDFAHLYEACVRAAGAPRDESAGSDLDAGFPPASRYGGHDAARYPHAAAAPYPGQAYAGYDSGIGLSLLPC